MAEGAPTHRNFGSYLSLAVLLIALVTAFATGLHRSLSFATFLHYQVELRELVGEHRLAMLGLYMAVYVAAVSLSLPASAFLTTIGGYLFGWALGGLAASMAATLGATCIFALARTSLGGPLLERAGARIRSLAAGFQKQAFSYLLFLRLMPVMPFWLTNLAAAFFGMRLKSYALATYLGILPACFAFAFAGSGLDEVIAGHELVYRQCLAGGQADCSMGLDARSLLTPELTMALSILGVLALAPLAVRYWRERKEP
ncbi:TVP38/TMEM64 family protein [Microvirga sp. M2]|uniref:TVP38/TMEM64 family protein n=1 Tax=Microvirga sp. M2 TaxID=3073270 RepID=UPI0039C39ECD